MRLLVLAIISLFCLQSCESNCPVYVNDELISHSDFEHKIDQSQYKGNLRNLLQKDHLPSDWQTKSTVDFYELKTLIVRENKYLVYKQTYQDKKQTDQLGVATIQNDSIIWNCKIRLEEPCGRCLITINNKIQELFYLDDERELRSNLSNGESTINLSSGLIAKYKS